jgi:hypothetical protein
MNKRDWLNLIRSLIGMGLCIFALFNTLAFFNPSGVPDTDLQYTFLALIGAWVMMASVRVDMEESGDIERGKTERLSKIRLKGPFFRD